MVRLCSNEIQKFGPRESRRWVEGVEGAKLKRSEIGFADQSHKNGFKTRHKRLVISFLCAGYCFVKIILLDLGGNNFSIYIPYQRD